MSGNPYLLAAYSVTWLIHIAYLATIVRRYSRLKREVADLKEPGAKSGSYM
jgi:CcmD family protein